jgi:hypothetical protein
MERNWNCLTDCRYFLQNKCRYTSEQTENICPYRHPGHLLNRTQGPWKVCPKWDRYECYDVNCPNLHPASVEEYQLLQNDQKTKISTLKPTTVAAAVRKGGIPSAAPASSSTSSCIYFMRGKCVKGEHCPYLHEKHSLPSRASQQSPGPSLSPGDEQLQQGQGQGPERKEKNDCKRKAENILIKHSFKKSLQNNFQDPPAADSSDQEGGQQQQQQRERREEFESLEGIVSLSSHPVA